MTRQILFIMEADPMAKEMPAVSVREKNTDCYESRRKERAMPYNSLAAGQVIRELRLSRGLSQEVLSGFAGIARSHLAMIEAGRKCANVDTLWRIAEALDMKLSELMRLIEERC